MKENLMISHIFSWLLAMAVFVVGVLNMILVHPVPGVVYLFLSLVYFPPANAILKARFGFPIPLVVKIILGIFLFMFTLGVSDLGDMIDICKISVMTKLKLKKIRIALSTNQINQS